MKVNLIKSFFSYMFLFLLLNIQAQNYKISNWLDDKQCAIVLTFDDWDPAHPGTMAQKGAAERMVDAELPGTFFVTINNAWRSDDFQKMQDGADNGLEIANHTISHPALSSLSSTALTDEIDDCRTFLDSRVNQDYPVHTLAYPYGDFDQNVIIETKKNHIGARTVDHTINNWEYDYPTTEDEYFKIPTFQVGMFGLQDSDISNFNLGLDSAETGGGLYTLMYHSIGGMGWFDDIPMSLFMLQLDAVKARQSKDWVTTFSNAVRYHKEKHCATLSTVENNLETWTLSLVDTLADNLIYDQELTIKLQIPSGETYFTVKQGGVSLPFSVNLLGDTMTFNAVPDAGTIVLEKDNGVVTSNMIANFNFDAINIYPNPNNGVFQISGLESTNVESIIVLNALGDVIKSYSENMSEINIADYESGFYVIQFEFQNGVTHLEKIVKQ